MHTCGHYASRLFCLLAPATAWCPQVGTPAASATPQTLRAQLQKLQAQEEEAERLRCKLVGKVELLREEAAALRSLDQEKRQLEEQVGADRHGPLAA